MQNYIWSKDPPRGHSLFFDNLKNYASLDLRYEKESKFLSSKRSKSNQFVKKKFENYIRPKDQSFIQTLFIL